MPYFLNDLHVLFYLAYINIKKRTSLKFRLLPFVSFERKIFYLYTFYVNQNITKNYQLEYIRQSFIVLPQGFLEKISVLALIQELMMMIILHTFCILKCKLFQDYNNSRRDTEKIAPFFVWSLFGPVVLCVLSSLAIIFLRKRAGYFHLAVL